MRYDCIGAHGNAAIITPNLDRLVDGGVTLGQLHDRAVSLSHRRAL
jgi:arylsulfatase A-like enzyme